MVSERGFNPTAVIVHVLAITAGLLVGWLVMDRITPDFPTGDPGVESSSAPRSVDGNDPDSLFLPGNFSGAIDQVDDQLAAGESVTALHLTPGSISVQTTDAGGGFDLADVPVAAPAAIADSIHRSRGEVTLGDIREMDLVATRRGPFWDVRLVPARVDMPWRYTAPLDGSTVTAGG